MNKETVMYREKECFDFAYRIYSYPVRFVIRFTHKHNLQ